MRKSSKVFFIGIALAVPTAIPMFSQGIGIVSVLESPSLIANQFSQYYTAIDQLYSAYDQTMNTITMIEQNYKRIQQSIERMKSIDWENIRWDGDFDIRNDIRNANARVNRALDNVRNIRDTIYRPNIPVGNTRYSIADLCGGGKEGSNIATAFQDYLDFYEGTFKSAGRALAGDLTQAQRVAIMRKYGISPANFIMVQSTEATLRTKASDALARLENQAEQLQEEEKERAAILEGVFGDNARDSDGNVTQGATNEAIMRLFDNLISQITELKRLQEELLAMQGQKTLNEKALEESRAIAEKELDDFREYYNSRVSDSFYKRGGTE